MTESRAKYKTPADKDHAARVRRQAYAVRRVLDLEAADRPEACAKLEAAAYALPGWLGAVRRELDAGPNGELPALWAVLDRPELKDERDALAAAGVTLDKLLALDPADARKAYDAALADKARAGTLACIRSAESLLTQATAAETDADRRDKVLDAVRELMRPQAQGDAPLAEAWEAHLDRMAAHEAGPHDVLCLDADKRGSWAAWMNDNLGDRGGLEPGETFILGGAPEAGKTSLAALFAVDALAAGCPVLCWQMELSRERMLEHLLAQVPEPAAWWTVPFRNRVLAARRPLPPEWADLLTIPARAWKTPEVEAVLDALGKLTQATERARRAGKLRHKVNGLLIVDYMQLLTVKDRTARDTRFEILEKAASRLAAAAEESGACLLLCSQLNKQDQRDATTGGTALAGADIGRMAYRIALLQKADADGNPCKDGGEPVAWDRGKGEARLLAWVKARGVRYAPDGHRPDRERVIWYGNRSRAFHGGEAETGENPYA